jgi:hypothetical protein
MSTNPIEFRQFHLTVLAPFQSLQVQDILHNNMVRIGLFITASAIDM